MSSEDAGKDVSELKAESNDAPIAEKMLPQSKVTELVANARAVAEQKARAELEAQFAKEREQLMAQGQQPRSMGGVTQPAQAVTQDELMRLLDERDSKRERSVVEESQKREIERLAVNFEKLMEDGPGVHPDFKEVTDKYNPASKGNAKITLMLATLDNGNSVLYDMMQNRTKLSHIKSLVADGDDELAFDELKQLSDSIKGNKKAQEEYSGKPNPLSKPRASIAGADSGKKTIKDWKKVWRA